ncbi:methanethiol S-methyltransferase [Hahella sp. HN01]|uniref:methanethiol S-methyltransferase n=1 Tax=Hahella sp. HN01 TaxID=2847262 RepID=UPI001C1EFDB9|nr:methanethiol S-methyltransferase [Hahella sp. HN01]MBU6951755.1 isoprenylcysteine carboxylmethyltransferase family protein [Hahella sp. HN01]
MKHSRITVFAELAYAAVCYLAAVGAMFYFIAFINGLPVPKAINDGPALDMTTALCLDLGLIALFGVQHSLMARQSFKRWLTRRISPTIERATYCLATTLVFAVIFYFWAPLSTVVWSIDGESARVFFLTLAFAGWGVMFLATFMLDHFELFGLRQPWRKFRGQSAPASEFRVTQFYRVVRHPIQSGILVGMWSTSIATVGHCVFAGGMTLYILIGLYFEERDLVREFGRTYLDYRRRVGMLFPLPKREKTDARR